MTSIILFLLPGSPEQLAIAVLTTAWALVYVLAARPYADVSIGHMQAALLSAQTATLFCTLPPPPAQASIGIRPLSLPPPPPPPPPPPHDHHHQTPVLAPTCFRSAQG
eukprot:763281-Rhodomonas_salina.2